MSIKQMLDNLLNKKWGWEDLIWLILTISIASTFTTPLLGIPIGIIVYFLFFYKDDDFEEMAGKYDYQDDKKK